jgi:hypothetical protein
MVISDGPLMEIINQVSCASKVSLLCIEPIFPSGGFMKIIWLMLSCLILFSACKRANDMTGKEPVTEKVGANQTSDKAQNEPSTNKPPSR